MSINMNVTSRVLVFFSFWLFALNCFAAVGLKDAETLMKDKRYAEAASEYEKLVAGSPKDIKLRLRYAEALSYSRQWTEAIAQYQEVLKLQPDNSEAKRSMGSVYRWSGDIENSIQAYNSAMQQNSKDIGAQLGLASTYRLDHDFQRATEVLAQTEKQAPQDQSTQDAIYDLKRQKNPRVYAFYERGLTSETRLGGVIVPFLSREEVGYEYQDEIRKNSYTRSDNKFSFNHFFGYNHDFEFRYRDSTFDYDAPVTAFSAIDTFDEYRFAYLLPVTVNQAIRLRYTLRPTILKTTGQSFDSHKIEGELRSAWNPRFYTVLGTGWLRDLPEEATSTSQLKDNSLIRLVGEFHATNHTQVSVSYITNPDLDKSIDSTFILQANHSISNDFSALARFKIDDYKNTGDETEIYAGMRYTPNAHLWSEAGLKHNKDENESGFNPLVSLIWKF